MPSGCAESGKITTTARRKVANIPWNTLFGRPSRKAGRSVQDADLQPGPSRLEDRSYGYRSYEYRSCACPFPDTPPLVVKTERAQAIPGGYNNNAIQTPVRPPQNHTSSQAATPWNPIAFFPFAIRYSSLLSPRPVRPCTVSTVYSVMV